MKKEVLEKKYNIHANNIVSGRISSGKTHNMRMILDEVIENNESFLVVDSKEEYINKYSKIVKEKGYNMVVLNFKNPSQSDGYNPLEYPYNQYINGNVDESIESLDLIGSTIFYERADLDPFWEESSSSYFTGIALGLFQDAKKDEINFNSINNVFELSNNKYIFVDVVKKYFELKGKDSKAYVSASVTLNTAGETRRSIISVAKLKIRNFIIRESLSQMLANTTFDFNSINKDKTAIFIINKPDNKYSNILSNIFINQLYNMLSNNKNNFHFILDNFDSLPLFKNLMQMINYGNKLYFHIATQNIKNFIKDYSDSIFDIANHVETTDTFENTNVLTNDVVFPKHEFNKPKVFDIRKHVNEAVSKLKKKYNVDENIWDIPSNVSDKAFIDEMINKIDARIFSLDRTEYLKKEQQPLNTDKLCCIFEDLSNNDLTDKFNVVKTYIQENPTNYERKLLSCKKCGQLFINQKITWKHSLGTDKYDDYIQVEKESDADLINSTAKYTEFKSSNPSIMSTEGGYVAINILKK